MIWVLAGMLACDIGDATKDITSGVVSTTVEATKGVAEGIQDGVEEGRKGPEIDGSVVLSTPAEIAKATTLSVFEVNAGGGGTQVVLAVENNTDKPLHLIGLSEDGGPQLIDQDGFSTQLMSRETLIEVPPKAKIKHTLQFVGDAEKAASVRVWGQDLAIPVAAEAAE
jgi:hypothetical protein